MQEIPILYAMAINESLEYTGHHVDSFVFLI